MRFVQGIETLYRHGARTFVEVGPKRVLSALASDILKGRDGVAILATNHPRKEGQASLRETICSLLAAGHVPSTVAETPAPQLAARTEPPATQSGVPVECDTASIQTFVLGLVSEKTGYPAEMLEPDLDLEADLGIDTAPRLSVEKVSPPPERQRGRIVGGVADLAAAINAELAEMEAS